MFQISQVLIVQREAKFKRCGYSYTIANSRYLQPLGTKLCSPLLMINIRSRCYLGLALGLGHLGLCLRALTRGRPPNFGAKFDIFFIKKIWRYRIKNEVYIFPLLLRSPKELSNAKDNTTLNTWVLQIYVSLITRNNSSRKMLEILLILLENFTN